jgi:hypothetical protein
MKPVITVGNGHAEAGGTVNGLGEATQASKAFARGTAALARQQATALAPEARDKSKDG